MSVRRALYAGSFDPPTLGHLWVIGAGLDLFDEVIIAVTSNPAKRAFVTAATRVALLDAAIVQGGLAADRTRVITFANRFTVDVAREFKANFLLRGIRGSADVEGERTLSLVNGDLAPELASVFLMPPRGLAEISSSFVRGLVGLEGWQAAVARMVPPVVLAHLERSDSA